ncbi:hypothetical protein Btru_069010 [Bulinus truncatus]|nr:hypothetical protein Btru_069010 [Bulinus truncatus]
MTCRLRELIMVTCVSPLATSGGHLNDDSGGHLNDDSGGHLNDDSGVKRKRHNILTLHFPRQSICKGWGKPDNRLEVPLYWHNTNRLLGFHRVPPTVGRLMNVSQDLHRLANRKLAKTFFISPAGNWCFHGSCSYYCDSSHPICGHPIMLEGSMAAFLPPVERAKRKTWRNPWKRSYSKHKKAYWELNNDLCEKIKVLEPYNSGRRLLDILDMAVFDFLTGNLDRHHYETFLDFNNETFLLHLDNGRAFGKSKYDCISCIAPVRQCCMIRLSTLSKLVKLYSGPDSLSMLMRLSLHSDPVDPILVEPHLDALDRRVTNIVFKLVLRLLSKYFIDHHFILQKDHTTYIACKSYVTICYFILFITKTCLLLLLLSLKHSQDICHNFQLTLIVLC